MTPEQFIGIREPGVVIDARVLSMVELTTFYLGEDALGRAYPICRGLLVLHWLAVETAAGNGTTGSSLGAAAGPLSSEQEGDLSKAYATGDTKVSGLSGLENLNSTAYGKELAAMIRANVSTAFLATDPDE